MWPPVKTLLFCWFVCLQKSIFHKVRDQPQLLQKVTAIAGDITQPGLGLSP
jgi:hypothetical protein